MKTNTHPNGPNTGYGNAKCYARGDRNCSDKISKEHFISATLLRQLHLNDTVKIAGLRWQQKETFKVVPLSGLASSILCERHNNALSPLDAVMGAFAQAIGDCDDALKSSGSPADLEQRDFSGDNIERWMVKCLLGLTASKNLNTTNLKPECVDLLFANIAWPEGWGLYFSATSAAPIHYSASFLIETMIDPARDLVLAAKFVIRGLPFTLCLGKPDNPASFGLFRPEAIVFRNGSREKVLALSWHDGPRSSAILLQRTGAYDGAPPDWKEWERNG
jgi:hypothetical protein